MLSKHSQTFLTARSRLFYAIGLSVVMLAGGVSQSSYAAQTWTAGSPPTSAPMSFLDVPTNTIQGVMPDIMREIGKREGFDVNFEAIPFPALIQSAVSDKIDIIVSAMTPTPKRAEVVDFADVVYQFGEGLIVPDSDKTNYKVAAELKGTVIGAPVGTTYAEALRKMPGFAEVKLYDSPADMFTDLQNGRIKAAFIDYPLVKALVLKGGLPGFHVVESYKPLTEDAVAIAVKKGNKSLLDKINDGISKMKADGSLIAILKKWQLQ
jgi:polar amino acid transport system substrate-binding protein